MQIAYPKPVHPLNFDEKQVFLSFWHNTIQMAQTLTGVQDYGEDWHTLVQRDYVKDILNTPVHQIPDFGEEVILRPLTWLCWVGLTEQVKALVALGVPLIDPVDEGFGPLYAAARGGQLETLQYLVAEGLDLNEKSPQSDFLLFYACLSEEPSVIQYVATSSAQINEVFSSGDTALHMLMKEYEIGLAESLIQAGARLDIPNKEGETVLELMDKLTQQKPPYGYGSLIKQNRIKELLTVLKDKVALTHELDSVAPNKKAASRL